MSISVSSRLLCCAQLTFYCLALVIGSNCAQTTNSSTSDDESTALKKLRQELLITRQYDRISRPVKNHKTQVNVDMRITINELVELNIPSAMLVTDAWFHITWRDELLSWDPNNYQQLKQIHMHPNEVWRPDIVLINTADQDNLINVFTESEVIVNSTGDITWITMGLMRSKCNAPAYDYPYVARPITCRLVFCSLIYESHEVNLTTPGNEFFLAGPWFVNPRLQFINATGDRFERSYDNYGTYSFEQLSIQLKRRENMLPLLMRVPTLTSIAMVLCMFFMPVTWSIRVHLSMMAIFIQLLLILYIGLLQGPNSVGVARSVYVLRADLLLSALALVMTLVFRRLLALADQLPELPYLVSSLLGGPLARLLCFGINQKEYTTAGVSAARAPPPSLAGSMLPQGLHRQSLFGGGGGGAGDRMSLINEDQGGVPDLESGGRNTITDSLDNELKNGTSPHATMGGLVQLSYSQFEWMQLIIFCDRLMFIMFALIMLPRLM